MISLKSFAGRPTANIFGVIIVQQLFTVHVCARHCRLAPLMWGIFESPSTGSEYQWENWAEHEIQLNRLYFREEEKMICFFGF